jgi:beta-galactosidase
VGKVQGVGVAFVMAMVNWTSPSNPATAAAVPPEVENEQVLGLNKEPAHATLMPYASLQEALAAQRQASSLCRSLNGSWKFNWVPRPEERPVDFYKSDFDVSGWKEIPSLPVGSCSGTARPTTATSATPSSGTGRG